VPHRYLSVDEDSDRWSDFPFRSGDIVISTRSKSGTTWMQMICALLIFQTPQLPAPLSVISPWLDWVGQPRQEVVGRLAAQRHRRVIKTHTPLDGLPLDDRATYIVMGRHPLDSAVSLYHQGNNIDRVRQRQRAGRPEPSQPEPPSPPLREWLLAWVNGTDSPREHLDSLPGVFWHLSDAWRRRQPNVVLVHYDDLQADLRGAMVGLADRLGIPVPAHRWPALVEAATFASMRASARQWAPNPDGILKDPGAFFRHGVSGEGAATLGAAGLARYYERARELAVPDLVTWIHRA
jgi:hypothetical protein